MTETVDVNLFDRMRPAYQKWAEPVTRVLRALFSSAPVLTRVRVSSMCVQELGHLPTKQQRMGYV